MKQYVTIKRTKAGITVVEEHDDLKTANEDRYQKNTNDQTPGVVYETWTREEWNESSETKLA